MADPVPSPQRQVLTFPWEPASPVDVYAVGQSPGHVWVRTMESQEAFPVPTEWLSEATADA